MYSGLRVHMAHVLRKLTDYFMSIASIIGYFYKKVIHSFLWEYLADYEAMHNMTPLYFISLVNTSKPIRTARSSKHFSPVLVIIN